MRMIADRGIRLLVSGGVSVADGNERGHELSSGIRGYRSQQRRAFRTNAFAFTNSTLYFEVVQKDYAQFCGLAKASSLLGERWSLLILRDLSVQPRRFKDLLEGLPGIPTSLLTMRLRDLQAAHVVTRVAEERPGGAVLYTLTPRGEALEPVLDALGRWGAATMVAPKPDEVVTGTSLAAALRAGYRSGVTDSDATYVVHTGPATAWAATTQDSVTVGAGAPDVAADLTIHCGPELRALLAGNLAPAAALASGAVRIEGSPEMFERFASTFRVPLVDIAENP